MSPQHVIPVSYLCDIAFVYDIPSFMTSVESIQQRDTPACPPSPQVALVHSFDLFLGGIRKPEYPGDMI